MHLVGAAVFFLVAVAATWYGIFNLTTVRDTPFGEARVATALPVSQFVLAAGSFILAIASAKACSVCWTKSRPAQTEDSPRD